MGRGRKRVMYNRCLIMGRCPVLGHLGFCKVGSKTQQVLQMEAHTTLSPESMLQKKERSFSNQG